MAKLVDLVPLAADLLQLPVRSAHVVARYLRAAKLLSTDGRGAPAAPMKASDCTNLLLGMIATDKATDAARAVGVYRSLRKAEAFTEAGRPANLLIAALASPELPLGSSLDLLFDAARMGDLQPLLTDDDAGYGLTVTISRPRPSATIVMMKNDLDSEPSIDDLFDAEDTPTATPVRRGLIATKGGDARYSVTVGMRTFTVLGEAIRESKG